MVAEGYVELARQEIRSMRLGAGLSQAELGAESGLSTATVSLIENGRQGMSLTQFVALCVALGEHPSEAMRRIEQQAILDY